MFTSFLKTRLAQNGYFVNTVLYYITA